MKGADSAMPIWADFMKEALQMHPEWNGDWAMPANVRRAEIDTRTGDLIRELDAVETAATTEAADPSLGTDPSTGAPTQEPTVEVPSEFRRVELFIPGTVPAKKLSTSEGETLYDPDTGEPLPPPDRPKPTPTPIDETWQDDADDSAPTPNGNTRRQPADGRPRTVSVKICPLTGMRATVNCPNPQLRSFEPGTEPKDFCTFHVNPPR